MIRFFALALALSLSAAAQVMRNHIFKLDNGAQVLYQTYSEIARSDPENEKTLGAATASGNVIRRTMLDGNGNPWVAFNLRIERKPGPGPVRFLLSMEPIGGWPFFQQKPSPREIKNGDRILMDVLEQPDTGRKIFDTFQVGVGVPMQIMPISRSIPQVPRAGTLVHLRSPRFLKGLDSLGKNEGVVTGTQIALTVPGKGRFSFSSQPEPDFRMEAIADGSLLRFVVGNDRYDIQCSDPVVAPSGSWYLWVRHEPAPQGGTTLPRLDLSIE